MSELAERLRLWADADVMETARDGTFEYNDAVKWAALMEEAADALEAAQARIEAVRRETVEVQNPIEELRLAALTVFPDIDCLVRFATMPEEGPYGETFWPADGGRTLVHVAVGIPMEAVIEVMAHELAHVAAGPDADHGPRWEEAFEQIHAAYCARALTEAKEDHIPDARKMVEAKEDRT